MSARLAYDDAFLRRVLMDAKTIAVVGASSKPTRASHRVMAYLQSRGYRTIPVNPYEVGRKIHRRGGLSRAGRRPGAGRSGRRVPQERSRRGRRRRCPGGQGSARRRGDLDATRRSRRRGGGARRSGRARRRHGPLPDDRIPAPVRGRASFEHHGRRRRSVVARHLDEVAVGIPEVDGGHRPQRARAPHRPRHDRHSADAQMSHDPLDRGRGYEAEIGRSGRRPPGRRLDRRADRVQVDLLPPEGETGPAQRRRSITTNPRTRA